MTEAVRILIVDDEALARQRIARLARQASDTVVIEEAESGLAAVEAIASFRPHVLFLDVEMPGMSGFDLLRQLEARPFKIVFATAHDEFAIRAFEEEACDYLLKPFTAERFRQALDRAMSRAVDEARLAALEARLSAREGALRRLAVRQGGRLRLVDASEIACFVSRDHVTCVYFEDGREGIVDLSLARLEEQLDPRSFRRLHRGSIVRTSAIRALLRRRDGGVALDLSNGMTLPVARSSRSDARSLVLGGVRGD